MSLCPVGSHVMDLHLVTMVLHPRSLSELRLDSRVLLAVAALSLVAACNDLPTEASEPEGSSGSSGSGSATTVFPEDGSTTDGGDTTGGDSDSSGATEDSGSSGTSGMAVCGDGQVDGGEVCDDGNNDDGDGCSANCQSDESCGNVIVDASVGEVCDDGNVMDGDGCSADCSSAEVCGNGIIDAVVGETCDDGNVMDGDGCSADCSSDETCGNGIVDLVTGEECDDGNVMAGDGCDATCLQEPCGNGVIDPGEVCDDGNNVANDGCPADCVGPVLFSEDFQGMVMPPEFTLFNEDGLNPAGGVSYVDDAWIVRDDFVYEPGNYCAFSTSWYVPLGQADDWMVLPVIDLGPASFLSWRSAAPDAMFADGFEVRISTTDATVMGLMANAPLLTVPSEADVFTYHAIDLAAAGYANQSVFIAFRNNSDDDFLLLVDNLVVE